MLTHEQQLHLLIDRWASRRGPFMEWHGGVVAELQDVKVDEPATLERVEGYALTFMKDLGSVYHTIRLISHHVDQHIAACRFGFGEGGGSGKLRDVGAALVGPLIRWEGPTLLVAKPAKRYQWVQAAAILDADDVFGRLVEMGF